MDNEEEVEEENDGYDPFNDRLSCGCCSCCGCYCPADCSFCGETFDNISLWNHEDSCEQNPDRIVEDDSET